MKIRLCFFDLVREILRWESLVNTCQWVSLPLVEVKGQNKFSKTTAGLVDKPSQNKYESKVDEDVILELFSLAVIMAVVRNLGESFFALVCPLRVTDFSRFSMSHVNDKIIPAPPLCVLKTRGFGWGVVPHA